MNCLKCYRFFCCCSELNNQREKVDDDNITISTLHEYMFNPNLDIKPFYYEPMCIVVLQGKYIKNQDYMASLKGDGYIHIYKITPNIRDRYENSEGWKIHISINNEILGNLCEAWNKIMPILMRHGVYHFKVLAPYKQSCSFDIINKAQKGKEIVIYEFESRADICWEIVFNEIHHQLLEIPAGEPPFFRCKPSLYTDIFKENRNCELSWLIMVLNKIWLVLKKEKVVLNNIQEYKIENSQHFYVTDDSKDEKYIKQHINLGLTEGPFSRVGINLG